VEKDGFFSKKGITKRYRKRSVKKKKMRKEETMGDVRKELTGIRGGSDRRTACALG